MVSIQVQIDEKWENLPTSVIHKVIRATNILTRYDNLDSPQKNILLKNIFFK